ncbi:hypothetical protein AB835_11690 [Candidatus Endobugula sertula]|uniref:MobA/VirD2-like nuclease domain-containing protein n=1 Tax=Candidatus Endobugula sertula TaxID=62101 RepID=A0A1D2QMW0_9GAMM|nr:hypothetical protein AB835_11690 [Candidatus Endobugula sertula]
MICFASQRGFGQDLATHLLNEHDNEVMEFAQLRGSVTDDLHGAFAEWQLQAETLTRCKNYLYSVSINPDHSQGEFTREHYMTFIERMEDKLGLSNQPRAMVFHCKHDREHCHVVYSRIDVENQKAVHMAFDKDKLMMVTRQFARDYGIQLPDGYYKARGQHEGKEPLSLYEKRQYEETGFTKAQRMEQVTDLWRQSDSAKAFVAGLEEAGYVLCTGRRDYVLVDYYGLIRYLSEVHWPLFFTTTVS